MNMPIQGTEADLMKMAMINVDQKISTLYPKADLLLQIHDSILVECPLPVAQRVGDLLKSTMESVYKLPVNLVVDVSIGQNWGEL
jgi:DNA polymerase-1